VRSKIGGLWMILNPLAMVLIYALILSALLKAKLPGVETIYAYPIYLMAGILAWTIFSDSVVKSLTIFVDNANLIKKVAFPKLVLPIIVAGSITLNSLVLLLVIFVVFAFLGHYPGIQALWLPVLFFITLLFGMSIGLILGVLNVFIRDIGQVVPVMLQLGFWLTPIVYTISIIPEAEKHWFDYNPMMHIAVAFKDVLLYNRSVDLYALTYFLLVSVGLLALGLFMFKKSVPEMVDQL
jgi:lipopolysaccharide transport system permease protein